MVSKLIFKSGSALIAVMALASAAHAEPTGLPPVENAMPVAHHHRFVRVSKGFKTQSHVVAVKTVGVMQTGTPGSVPVATTVVASPIVACPAAGDTQDEAWKALPAEIRNTAHPGQCYSRLLLPPKMETYMDHVMTQDARVETHVVPEVTQMVAKDVMVAPERVLHKTVAAVTHTVMETEVVRPASFREEQIPAQYETRIEHIMVSPEHQAWVETRGVSTGAALITPDDHQPVRYRADGTLNWPGKDVQPMHTSEDTAQYLQQGSGQVVYCLKLIPALYEDRRTQVEVVPASVRHIDIPAVTRQVERTVVDVPEHVEDVTVPAVYEKRQVKEVVTPEHTESVNVPAVYQDVQKTRVTEDARPVWREVLCQRNASRKKVSEIQRALTAKGYNTGPINGELNARTVAAMQKFEADHYLPQGQVSIEAVELLGIQAD